jgi:hypothetical protein
MNAHSFQADRSRLAQATGIEIMDRVTEVLLGKFSAEHEIEALPEDKRFEHFSAFSVIRRHYSRSFSTDNVVLGGGGDTGIDAIAIIVNNILITDVDTLHDTIAHNDYVDPVFIFVQSERSANFDGQKIGNFGFGAVNFFDPNSNQPRSDEVKNLVSITNTMLTQYAHLMKAPRCYLYYITTGIWLDDANLIARRNAVVEDIGALSIFNVVEMHCLGASDIRGLYQKTKSPISRQVLFENKVEMAATEGVTQSLMGFMPFPEFKKLIADESGSEILSSIFEDNIRDWQGYKTVNTEMKDTLLSDKKSKFVLMNNGVTIITRGLARVSNLLTLTDYQIVNGCQTSNVLFEQRDDIDGSVQIPLRIIHTEDESIKELITKATNRQTAIKPDQFASSMDFARLLEDFFATYPPEHRLYYERRDGQYDRGSEPKARVIDTPTILRSYASIFREAPHAVTRSYRSITEEIGDTIFADGDKPIAYYYAAYSWFILESLFKAKVIDSQFKSARYHMIMAVHLMIDSNRAPHRNSGAIEKRSEEALELLWDEAVAGELFKNAADLIKDVTDGNLDRDHVRTEAITDAILAKLRTPPAATDNAPTAA